jgi:serine/threonine protein kinase
VRFPAPGDIFEGRYQVGEILGTGGFARVYKAREIGLERDVALKLLRPPLVDGQNDSERETYRQTLIQRFQREAMLLSRLRCPHTVTMYHYGQSDDGLFYMALEYIDGISLAELLREGVPAPHHRVARVLNQVLQSLHEAHTLGMLHRDLKPANVMIYEHLGDADQIKLLDFGIAKTLGDAPGHKRDLTSDGTLIGTPRYMAPEQIQGRADVGPAIDIYALGLVAYELLVGRRAIEGDSSIQIIGRQLAAESFRLPDTAEMPIRLRRLVNRMMEKDLTKRYTSAQAVLVDLRDPDLLNLALQDPSIELEPADLDPSHVVHLPEGGFWRIRLPLIGIGVLCVVLGIGGTVLWSQQNVTIQVSAPSVSVVSFSVDANDPATQISVDGKPLGRVPVTVRATALPLVVVATRGATTQKRLIDSAKPVSFEFAMEAKVDPLAKLDTLIERHDFELAITACQEADSLECVGKVGLAAVDAGDLKQGCAFLKRAGASDERCTTTATKPSVEKPVPTRPQKTERVHRNTKNNVKPSSAYTKIILE